MSEVKKLMGTESPLEVGQKINEIIEKGVGGGAGLQLFDTILKDHVLTYKESKGLALQGTYVYKEAVAGSRYGYPDFYNKCLEERNVATATQVTLGSSTITMYIASNGHQYYDIANKDVVDAFFGTMGTAWFYGVDTENECIFLPRNNYFEQATADILELGKSIEAGLPNIKGEDGVTGRHPTANRDIQVGAIRSLSGNTKNAGYHDSSTSYNVSFEFDASKSNAIYGKSKTVQPNAVKKLLYICVGNTTSYEGITEVVNQGMDILAQVNEGISTRADGQWVTSKLVLASSQAVTGSTNITYDLSEYLPKDGYDYEVMFYGYASTEAVNNAYLSINLTNEYGLGITITRARARSAASYQAASTCILPIGTQRFVKFTGEDSTNHKGDVNIYALAYRRIGKNV